MTPADSLTRGDMPRLEDAERVFAVLPDLRPDPYTRDRADAGLPDWPYCKAVAPDLVPLVVDLYDHSVGLITEAKIAEFGAAGGTTAVAAALCDAGWLRSLRSPGVWLVRTSPTCGVPGFEELLGCLAVLPETPACIAGKSVPFHRSWLPVPHVPTIGFPPGMQLPPCLRGFAVHRWRPRSPLGDLAGTPAWSVDTLLAFMATCPGEFSWADIALWLEDACVDASFDGLAAELVGASRARWCTTAYLVAKGGRGDIAEGLLSSAPPGEGPHVFGDTPRDGPYAPEHVPQFDVVDLVLPQHWFPQADLQSSASKR